MNNKKHQTCTVTVMDTTDPNIKFDENGICHYVKYYEENILYRYELCDMPPQHNTAQQGGIYIYIYMSCFL